LWIPVLKNFNADALDYRIELVPKTYLWAETIDEERPGFAAYSSRVGGNPLRP
jgi:hypothetical protein